MTPNLYEMAFVVAHSLGLHPLTRRPGCTEVKLPEGWAVIINPHETRADCSSAECAGWVPARTVVVTFQGYPVGVLTDDGCAVWLADVAEEAAQVLRLELEIARRPMKHGGLNG